MIYHGTAHAYYDQHCGCLDCYNASVAWQEKRVTEGPHGTAKLYQYGCRCDPCKEAAREYRAAHAAKHKVIRDTALAHYSHTSPPSCKCCHTTENLVLDHTYGDGPEHRAMFGDPKFGGWRLAQFLIDLDFPPAYDVYCAACNRSKAAGPRCRINHQEAA